jgi:hypothetical protein
MFVFWRQAYGIQEGLGPLVHPIWVWDGSLGCIVVHYTGFITKGEDIIYPII